MMQICIFGRTIPLNSTLETKKQEHNIYKYKGLKMFLKMSFANRRGKKELRKSGNSAFF